MFNYGRQGYVGGFIYTDMYVSFFLSLYKLFFSLPSIMGSTLKVIICPIFQYVRNSFSLFLLEVL
jgi:hypothetical protein